MKALRVAMMRVLGLFASDRPERELDEELETIVQLQTDDNIRRGMTPAEARRHALIAIGGVQSVKQAHREQRSIPVIETALHDLRFGVRMLRRHRDYSIVAVFTLALGIASTTAMVSIVDAVMLRPFPFPDPERLVMISETNPARNIDTFPGSAANYVDWRAGATTFTDLGAWETRHDNRTDGVRPERVEGATASSAFFRALGIAPQHGRFFRDEEDAPAGRFVAVLGYEYWRREFNADPAVLGRTLTLNGEVHTVIGVAPPLRSPFTAEVWRPLAADVSTLDRGSHSLRVIGRLAPGQTLASAEAELQSIAGRLASTYPESNRGWSVRAQSIYNALVPERTRNSMVMLLMAVAVLLLIACVNVASLTLARATTRVREFATRSALGAGRSRLVRQLLTESMIVALASGAVGVVAGAWLLDLVQWLFPADIPGLADAQVNPYVVTFAVGLASVTAILSGLMPAWQMARQCGQSQFLVTRGATPSPHVRALRHMFVVAQIAMALVLLVVSGLLVTSVNRLVSVPLGFETNRVVSARITLDETNFANQSAYARHVERILDEVRRQPGVAAAGISSSVPLDGAYTVMAARRESDAHNPDADSVLTQWRVIGGDYLSVLNINLVAGRTFTAADDVAVLPRSIVISRSLAQQIFGDQDPIGRHVLVGDSKRPYRVVGIAEPARLTALDRLPEPTMYFHYRQFGWPALALVAQTAGPADNVMGAIRAAVQSVDPSQPVFDERRVGDLVHAAAAAPRMNAALLSTFALLALTLAAIGVYGVMSYTAAQRAPEMSLRLVLGARPASVFMLVCRHGLQLTAAGLAIGLTLAAAAAGALSRVLFQVSAVEFPVYVAAVSAVFAVALLACGIPAKRAMCNEPTAMLRQE